MVSPSANASRHQHVSVLVIGYGNCLRSDDGVGQCIANRVAECKFPDVKAIAIHQLTPELSEDLAHTNTAIFVDASRLNQQNVQLQSLVASHSGMVSGHWCDPPNLLAMTQALYGYHPCSWWLTVLGQQFEVGDCFSTVATQGVEAALQMIRVLIETARTEQCTKLE
ncbi:MAG: hydrogenase maturation protease [Oscillatoriophycideae cyanobacterium NC_groundwater_1537_Pr4_S-0.65um_50_18]|nr:hydrogenase maturation protease [Oscillatoriophycideae cyanobacterium NC_groundwater_1537_Pr4_S-0.65um_50_18]